MRSYFIVPIPFIFTGLNGKVNSDLVSYLWRALNRTIETANGKAHLAVITFAGFHDVLSLLPLFTIPGNSTGGWQLHQNFAFCFTFHIFSF